MPDTYERHLSSNMTYNEVCTSVEHVLLNGDHAREKKKNIFTSEGKTKKSVYWKIKKLKKRWIMCERRKLLYFSIKIECVYHRYKELKLYKLVTFIMTSWTHCLAKQEKILWDATQLYGYIHCTSLGLNAILNSYLYATYILNIIVILNSQSLLTIICAVELLLTEGNNSQKKKDRWMLKCTQCTFNTPWHLVVCKLHLVVCKLDLVVCKLDYCNHCFMAVECFLHIKFQCLNFF